MFRLDLAARGPNETDASRPRWPGVQTSRVRRKDGRSQRGSLADNLPANAADMVKAVHGGGAWASAPSASRACPRRPVTWPNSHVLKAFSAAARSPDSVAFMS